MSKTEKTFHKTVAVIGTISLVIALHVVYETVHGFIEQPH